jgi:hypothetical protein
MEDIMELWSIPVCFTENRAKAGLAAGSGVDLNLRAPSISPPKQHGVILSRRMASPFA